MMTNREEPTKMTTKIRKPAVWASIVLCPDGFIGYVIETSTTHGKVYDHPEGTNYGTTNRGRSMQRTARAFRLSQLVRLDKGEYLAKSVGLNRTAYTLTDTGRANLAAEGLI